MQQHVSITQGTAIKTPLLLRSAPVFSSTTDTHVRSVERRKFKICVFDMSENRAIF